ncbi:MAG: restriction endonuclease subunit S [Cytophagaceae bacterium]|nr:restriction endonuclease subunit S [Cytophagaceae bacterium]
MKDWKFVELGNVLNYEQPTKYIVESTNYDSKFATPVLTAGQSFILGYTDETEGIFKDYPVIIFDDFTTAFKYVDFPFKVKSSAMKILKEEKGVADLRFLFYCMQTIDFIPEQHKRYWISKYSNFQIPLPPLEEQKRIAAILDAADLHRQKTKAILDKYDQLAQALFLDMFGDTFINNKKWETVQLYEICSDIIDCPHSTPTYVTEVTEYPCIRTTEIKNGKIEWSKMKFLDYENYKKRTKRFIPNSGDIVYGRKVIWKCHINHSKNKNEFRSKIVQFRPKMKLVKSQFLLAVISQKVFINKLKK